METNCREEEGWWRETASDGGREGEETETLSPLVQAAICGHSDIHLEWIFPHKSYVISYHGNGHTLIMGCSTLNGPGSL